MGYLIRVIDFETTGTEPPAEVVEVGFCDLHGDESGRWAIGQHGSWLCGVDAIPPEVRAIHHIRVSDVAGLAPFDCAGLWAMAADDQVDVVAAHNMEFEAKFLGEAARPLLCTYKAALRVWPAAPSHSNGALRYWLEDQGLIEPLHEKTLPPHRAGPDAYVTAHLLQALLTLHTAAEMIRWTKEPRLLPTCPIGKFRGKPWAEVEAGFLDWMLAQASMEPDLKWNARRELERRRATSA